jgi:hypothetical protein
MNFRHLTFEDRTALVASGRKPKQVPLQHVAFTRRFAATSPRGEGSALRMLLHTCTVKAQPPRVMILVHHAVLLEAPDLRTEGTYASIRDSG